MKSMSKFAGLALAAGITLSMMPGSASAVPVGERYDALMIFGDSLSDNGNLFSATGGASPAAPYFDGRFSNGPVWAEPLMADVTAAGGFALNTAFGGAWAGTNADAVPDLSVQISTVAASVPGPLFGGNVLASVWAGANDLFGAIGGPDSGAAARSAAGSVADGIRALSALGVTDFVVFNLPDIGATPSYALFQPGLAAEASLATDIFNETLALSLEELEASGLRIIDIDTFAIFEDVLANPAKYGVANTVLPCVYPSADVASLFGEGQVCSAAEADVRAFFDGVHPNSALHSALSGIVAEEIAAVPLPGAFGLLAVGFLGLVGARISRKA